MNKLKIKETYLVLLIVLGLISLGIYSTYALFTASTTINDVVGITATLDIGKSLTEYEVITINPDETKLVELNIVNSYNSNIYYGAWYQLVQGNSSDIDIGLYTEKNSNPGSGSLNANSNINLLVGVTNNGTSSIVIYIGVKGSLSNELNLGDNKILISSGFSDVILVTDELLEQNSSTTTETKDFSKEYLCTKNVQTQTLNPGTYTFKVWGAQGGNSSTSSGTGGKGGYSKGTLTLSNDTNLYIYVGCKGINANSTTDTLEGGYNGGGTSIGYAGSGGGSTDIRLINDSLYSRVIVAGGGGGGANYSSNVGGAGGGASGIKGTGYQDSTSGHRYQLAYGGTISSGGTGGGYSSSLGIDGEFGVGGNGSGKVVVVKSYGSSSQTVYAYAGGGGSGWYGGGGGGINGNSYNAAKYYEAMSGGGGGSGWVYTEDNYNTWKNKNSSASLKWVLNSDYYLSNAQTVDGSQSFESVSGGTETGHSGDGYAKISGTAIISNTTYSIPRLIGLTDLKMHVGRTLDLTSDVTLKCEYDKSGCSIVKVLIEEKNSNDTSLLSVGSYVIRYIVKSTENKKYAFQRNLIVTEERTSLEMLTYLGFTVSEGAPDFSKTSCSDSSCDENTTGVYLMKDDFGDSYYFRGDMDSYVKFGKYATDNYTREFSHTNQYHDGYFTEIVSSCGSASVSCTKTASKDDDMYWKIVRINGDGSIRLIYTGTQDYINGTSTTYTIGGTSYMGTVDFDTTYHDMMEYLAIENYSNLQKNLDSWYERNFKNFENYTKYITDSIYCSDRIIYETKYENYTATDPNKYHNAYYMNFYNRASENEPILICLQDADKYSVGTDIGNGKLKYPVALITGDEYKTLGLNYWVNGTVTMSPYKIGDAPSPSLEFFGSGGLRPVISIKSNVTITGSGTKSDPFVIL